MHLEKTCGEGDGMWLMIRGGSIVAQLDDKGGLAEDGKPPLA